MDADMIWQIVSGVTGTLLTGSIIAVIKLWRDVALLKAWRDGHDTQTGDLSDEFQAFRGEFNDFRAEFNRALGRIEGAIGKTGGKIDP